MKILILTVVVLALMTLTMTSRQMAEASVNTEDNNNSNMSMNEILQSILSDLEFLSLDSQQQLQVLLTIYEMLVDHYNKMVNMKDNRRE